jgi:uncharacterized protein (DUF58 family)
MIEASEILKRIRKIEIKTKGLSKHLFSGDYHSAFKGRGMAFSEVRAYTYGDDVRNIDWNVTARTGDTHIKVFEEERELTLMLLVDISRSSFYGTRSHFKSDIIAEISGVLAFSAISNQDKVGAILFSDQIEKYIPPKKGKSHILRILREIIYHKPEGKGTHLGQALEYLNNVVKKRSIVFILSDFLTEPYETALRVASKRHDVIGLHLFDRSEYQLPDVGLLKTRDLETGESLLIDTSSKKLRKEYEQSFARKKKDFKQLFQKMGLDTIEVQVKEDYVKVLRNFFKKRIG